jgi:hypothetical protein
MLMLTFIGNVNKPPPYKNIMKSVGLVVVNAVLQTPKCVKCLPTVASAIDRLVSFQMWCHILDVTVVFMNSRDLKYKIITR